MEEVAPQLINKKISLSSDMEENGHARPSMTQQRPRACTQHSRAETGERGGWRGWKRPDGDSKCNL